MQVVSALALMERIKQYVATLGNIDLIALINTVLIINIIDNIGCGQLKMTRNREDYIPLVEFLDLIDDLKMKRKEAIEILGVSDSQFKWWVKRREMPKSHYWAFQKELTIFLQKQMIKKMIRIGLIDKEFLRELLECV